MPAMRKRSAAARGSASISTCRCARLG
jgi:hypothetical protein